MIWWYLKPMQDESAGNDSLFGDPGRDGLPIWSKFEIFWSTFLNGWSFISQCHGSEFREIIVLKINMDVSKNRGTPQSSILIRFSIILTIHFGVPLFLVQHPYRHTHTHTHTLNLNSSHPARKPGTNKETHRLPTIIYFQRRTVCVGEGNISFDCRIFIQHVYVIYKIYIYIYYMYCSLFPTLKNQHKHKSPVFTKGFFVFLLCHLFNF